MCPDRAPTSYGGPLLVSVLRGLGSPNNLKSAVLERSTPPRMRGPESATTSQKEKKKKNQPILAHQAAHELLQVCKVPRQVHFYEPWLGFGSFAICSLLEEERTSQKA